MSIDSSPESTSAGGAAAVIDEVIEHLQVLLQRVVAVYQTSRVKRQSLVLDTIPLFGVARDIMMLAVSDADDADRSQLLLAFGGDCLRISRLHVSLDAVVSLSSGLVFAESDCRLPQCLAACQSVEAVLQSVGLGYQLRQALSEERERLQNSTHHKVEEGSCIVKQKAEESMQTTPRKEEVLDPLRPSTKLSWRVPVGLDPLRKLPGEHGLSGRERFKTDPQAICTSLANVHHGDPNDLDNLVSNHFASLVLADADTSKSQNIRRSSAPTVMQPELRIEIQILSSLVSDDATMWYSIKVRHSGITRFLHKRYNDFKSLHQSLEKYRWANFSLPDLPPPGLIGMRHKLNIGTFNERRQCGLQRYLEELQNIFNPLSRAPALVVFLGLGDGYTTCVCRDDGIHD